MKRKSGDAAKAVDRERESFRAKQRALKAKRDTFVGESEMTRDELIAKKTRMREEMYGRNPHIPRLDAA